MTLCMMSVMLNFLKMRTLEDNCSIQAMQNWLKETPGVIEFGVSAEASEKIGWAEY